VDQEKEEEEKLLITNVSCHKINGHFYVKICKVMFYYLKFDCNKVEILKQSKQKQPTKVCLSKVSTNII
jgi:hypothetical protein